MPRAAVLAALTLLANTSFALDLIESYQRARQVDATVLAADAAVTAGREKAVQGNALLRPRLNLSASHVHVDDRSSSPNLPPELQGLVRDRSSGNVQQAALRLTQPIVDAKAVADKAQLHEQTGLAEISYRSAGQDLMQRVASAYFNVLLAEEALRVTQAEKAATLLQRDRAQARFEIGRGKITDLQEAQARLDSVLTQEVSAESTLTQRQAQYEELTGTPALGLAALHPGFVPVLPQPDSLQAWQLKGADNNAHVLARQRELAIAAAEIGKYKLSGRPTLDLVVSVSDKRQHGGTSALNPDSSRNATIGLQFNLPLYAGGGITSREREAIAKQRQAEQQVSEARRDVRLQVQDAYLAVKTGVARIRALEQSVLSARTALEATALGRDLGTRTELDVLDAQQRLYTAQLDLAQARNDYLLGRIRLASAAGELGESDLHALNAYLAP